MVSIIANVGVFYPCQAKVRLLGINFDPGLEWTAHI